MGVGVGDGDRWRGGGVGVRGEGDRLCTGTGVGSSASVSVVTSSLLLPTTVPNIFGKCFKIYPMVKCTTVRLTFNDFRIETNILVSCVDSGTYLPIRTHPNEDAAIGERFQSDVTLFFHSIHAEMAEFITFALK